MTDNEVIKALECCLTHTKCEECPMNQKRNCMTELMKNALDLINRQKEEIEQWKEEANRYQNLWCITVDDIQTAKSEAYDEFAEKLSSYIYGELNNLIRLTSQELKKLVKKMKGELENDR